MSPHFSARPAAHCDLPRARTRSISTAEWQQKFKRGELLIISPFDSSIRRPTKEIAELRTRLVLSLARSKTIIHASPGGLLSRFTESLEGAAKVEIENERALSWRFQKN